MKEKLSRDRIEQYANDPRMCNVNEEIRTIARMLLALQHEQEIAEKRIAELEEAEQKLCAANVTLDARAELAERQLAEMVSRTVTVKLPPTFWYEHDDLSRDVPVLDKRLVKKMLREAGIKWEAE
ncbi:hypothetical protein [Klebsiella michiganensis]|uniref:hypothetical protein n=1 Tax=Klebsiella michiganensis TaxID=1134687 RepID=UPI001667F348|nr:hypothetical protein [Klebsiella michiganensis]MBD0980800.1 hypothetical protein [Klebsiella michiganensis]